MLCNVEVLSGVSTSGACGNLAAEKDGCAYGYSSFHFRSSCTCIEPLN